MSHGAPSSVTWPPVTAAATMNVPASIRSGDDAVLGAAQALAALDLDRVRVRPLDLGAHLLEERDEVVDLGLLGGRADDRVAVGERRGEHRVLGAHHRHEREADLGATQPAGRRREVVAVAVLDLAPSARIASTWRSTGRRPIRSPPGLLMMTRPKRARSGPRRMKLARILAAASSGHEQPLDVARGDLVDVRLGWSTTTPRSRSVSAMTRTSSISGTFVNRQRSPVRVAAASSFSAAFFAPLIGDRAARAAGRPRRGRRSRVDRLGAVLPVERSGVSHRSVRDPC